MKSSSSTPDGTISTAITLAHEKLQVLTPGGGTFKVKVGVWTAVEVDVSAAVSDDVFVNVTGNVEVGFFVVVGVSDFVMV